ncbi:MAG TPA: 3-deoxy-7-phosphoheptulonate synthase, partial [Bacillota bacterium]
MIIVMKPGAGREQVDQVIEHLERLGFGVHLSEGVEQTVIGAIGDKSRLVGANLELLPGVERVVPILKPFKLVSREFRDVPTRVQVGPVVFGGEEVVVAAGPCSVESREQLLEAAEAVALAGARLLRGGAFKPRT